MSMAVSKPTAWDIESELMFAIEELEHCPEGDVPIEIQELVLSCTEAAADKRDALAGAYHRKLAEIRVLEDRALDAEVKAKRVSRALERLEAYILSILDMRGEKQIRGEQYKIGWQRNPDRVQVDEDFGTDPVERAYVRVKASEEPDKKAIAEYLKAGGTLVRARLVEGTRRIVIR